PEFQLYLIEGTRDEVSDQHSYCFNVDEAINDEMDSTMGYNTWVLADLPPDGCEDSFLEWGTRRGGLYELTSGLHLDWQ
ncbi:hypothetical protein Tco_1348342, partial [Tanacetum coccineum]